MRANIDQVLGLAERYSEQRKIRSAQTTCNEALRMCSTAEEEVWVTYNAGAIFWSLSGDGEKAREHYAHVAALCELNTAVLRLPGCMHLYANACENMMILALSFEEYDKWTKEVRRLDPKAPVLSGQVPHVKETGERGIAWQSVMQGMARGYYNRNDAKLDKGMYGCAAAIYQLLLKNRRSLRVPTYDWKVAVYEFGTLRLRIAADSLRVMANSGRTIERDEYLFLLEEPKTYIEEYLSSNPADETIQYLSNHMNSFMAGPIP